MGLAAATARCGASRPLSAQVSRPSQRGLGDAPVIAAARTPTALTEPRMELCKSPECNLKAWPAGPLAASLGCPSQLQTTVGPQINCHCPSPQPRIQAPTRMGALRR